MPRIRAICAGVLAALLYGCGGWWPFGGSGETARIPAGATDYMCAEGKELIVRFAPDRSYAWVYLTDREFRLDRSGSDDRYSNGVSTLSLQNDIVHLDTEGSRQFADCKLKSS